MNKNAYTAVQLDKGEIRIYDFGDVKLYAYQTRDFLDNEVFVLVKNGKGIVIEQPCFWDNIRELTAYLQSENIAVVAKLIAYHAAGGAFLPEVPAHGTASSVRYNRVGGGAALIGNFASTFGEAFDASVCEATHLMEDGDIQLAGIRLVIASNEEAYDIEIPEIRCVYTHMLGHDCHSIVAGQAHADGFIAQLKAYIRQGIELVLTSHYTPEDGKDVQTKIDYLSDLKRLAAACHSAEEMKEKVAARYPGYSGQNYLDMTVGYFFPAS